jgi:carbon storage regulator
MLILGRREGDSILIEGGIRIVVVSCDRGGVRLGIEAPPEVKILRGEIADKVAQENQRATAEASPFLAALLQAGSGTGSGKGSPTETPGGAA